MYTSTVNYQAIKKDIQARSNDQGQIWDDQGLDPGRGSGHGLILGDPPLHSLFCVPNCMNCHGLAVLTLCVT